MVVAAIVDELLHVLDSSTRAPQTMPAR